MKLKHHRISRHLTPLPASIFKSQSYRIFLKRSKERTLRFSPEPLEPIRFPTEKRVGTVVTSPACWYRSPSDEATRMMPRMMRWWRLLLMLVGRIALNVHGFRGSVGNPPCRCGSPVAERTPLLMRIRCSGAVVRHCNFSPIPPNVFASNRPFSRPIATCLAARSTGYHLVDEEGQNEPTAAPFSHPHDPLLPTTRRSWLRKTTTTAAMAGAAAVFPFGEALRPFPADAAVGTLPELTDANALVQSLTIAVADPAQQQAMIRFVEEGFGFSVLRRRIRGTIDETWLGFGPEQLGVPPNFVLPVSSFAEYGGHASLHLVYDSSLSSPLYRVGSEQVPGSNVAYVQVAVPSYRISRLVEHGGIIQDAYGLVSVLSPAGLPMRGIVGIWPDPLMLVAIRCASVSASAAFYQQQLGFVPADMPYSRPGQGTTIFEPAPPPGSTYLTLAPPYGVGLGLLLLPLERNQRSVTPNPVLRSLNIVYAPPVQDDTNSDGGTSSTDAAVAPLLRDPSGIPITFVPVAQFEKEERDTR